MFPGGESTLATTRVLLSPPMNTLIVGRDKTPILSTLPDTFLLIDDGELIDQLELPPRRKVLEFDVAKHSFNPLRGINYFRAREIISILDAIFPEGDSTLTKKSSNFILLNALLEHPRRLDHLIYENTKDSAHTDAYQKIATLLLSPVLHNVLCRPTNVSFSGIILARLDRAKLGDFDCFVLANLLIQQYKGQIAVPAFDFYAAPHHTSLIRQKRLIAGVNFLDEVSPKMRNSLLLIKDKIASKTTAQDAEVLASYAGFGPTITGHSAFIEECIK